MFVRLEENREYSLNFINGKPSGKLLWATMTPGIVKLAHEFGYKDYWDFGHARLGCLNYSYTVNPTKRINKNLEVVDKAIDGKIIREYQSIHGTLKELRIEDQIVEHAVSTVDDLKILIKILEDTVILDDISSYEVIREQYEEFMPIVVRSETASAMQQFLQYEFGVMNFYYLLNDCPSLMEKCMETYQDLMLQKYRIMQNVECDAFFQGENTSTSLTSPEFYGKYGVPQVRQFVDAANAVNKRTIVHMCGLLHDLLPQIKLTGMNGVHALTPPPTGNVSFEQIYDIMPRDFSVLGRLGSLEWIGHSVEQIKSNLRRLLPHRIYQEYPFILLVSSDGGKYTMDDLEKVRDAINGYESEG